MIKISAQVDNDILIAYNDLLRDLPGVTQKAFRGEIQRIGAMMIRALSTEPGSPKYPLRWKSDKQRRYVMAKLRREGNLPYRRTHQLAQGWKFTYQATDSGAVFAVDNTSPYAQYVQGDDAQPFHLDTGWPQAADVFVKYEEIMMDALIKTWYSLFEFKNT